MKTFLSIIFVILFCLCVNRDKDNPFDQSGNNWNPPIVTAQADTSINIKDSIVLTATATDNGTVVSYFWALDCVNFIDTTVTGAIKTVFNTSGTDTVLVKVIDDDGVESQADDIIVTVTLDAPVVTAQADTSINIKDSIVLTATSTDNGTVVSYFWALDGVNFTDTTVTGAIKTVFNTSGTDTVLVKVIDDDGMESQTDDIIVTVTLDAPVVTAQADTIVSQTMNVTVNVIAIDTNSSGSIVKYLWDINADGWDDSTGAAAYTFSKAAGGTMNVIWGARDDDGVICTDTFAIRFNCLPSSASLSAPTSKFDWVGFNSSNYTGSLPLSFAGVDPDGVPDTLTYTLWLSSDSSSWEEKYNDKDTIYTAVSLDTVTKYFWKLRVVDLYGDSLTKAGSFITPSPPILTDTDGNVYHAIKIGSQVWTVENLRTTKYNDGTNISHLTVSVDWEACSTGTGAYCYYGNDSAANAVKYGALYNWFTVNTDKLAPTGWHVPTDAEWTELENYLIANGYNWDGTTSSNKIAKSMAAKTDWISSVTEGMPGNDMSSNNSSGFSALPGGSRGHDGHFSFISYRGYWWSASEFDASYAYYRLLCCDTDNLIRLNFHMERGFYVRLLRDSD